MICLAFRLPEIFIAALPHLLLKDYPAFVTHDANPLENIENTRKIWPWWQADACLKNGELEVRGD